MHVHSHSARIAGIPGRPAVRAAAGSFYGWRVFRPELAKISCCGHIRKRTTVYSLVTAWMEQLGLGLELRRGSVEVVVIDRIETLSRN